MLIGIVLLLGIVTVLSLLVDYTIINQEEGVAYQRCRSRKVSARPSLDDDLATVVEPYWAGADLERAESVKSGWELRRQYNLTL